ncbi:hypothetical protein Tco_0219044 [Tanacetum coccineum]
MGDEVHRAVYDNLVRGNSKYKQDADHVDFEVGDFMWAVLTKDRFPVGEYSKLSTKKIGPLEIIEKIDSNAYRLKLPSHIRCSDIFNAKHLLPYHGDSSDDDLVMNSRENLSTQGGMMQAQVFLDFYSICYLVYFTTSFGIKAEVPVKMPPRRNRPLTEAYEQEFDHRVMARMKERLDQFVDQLSNRMNDMMNPRKRRDRNSRGSEGEEEDNRRWELGMRVNIPEFDEDTLNPEGFIDWLVAVEEVFEFKEFPENKRVSLIATKLHGRASAWWQQLKLIR